MLRVDSLTKVYPNTSDRIAGGVRDASFTIPPGTFFTLLGPSGCGKTTTLRCLAGLERPDTGQIVLNDRVLFDSSSGISLPIDRRNIGMVFQSYAIWPHMTVAENVAFPLTVAKDRSFRRSEIQEHVKRALSVVSLDGFQNRSATQLSGGQQQRVALARAIVRVPALLLLDEPLSNLDAQLREEMRTELTGLQRKIGITTVYVTHDQAEALSLSHLVAVINQGRIVQIGKPRDIYYRPANTFVARFVGATNLLPGRMLGCTRKHGEAEILHGRRVRCLPPNAESAKAEDLVFSIRPETIRIASSNAPAVNGDNRIEGRVVNVTFLGQGCRVDVIADETLIQVTTTGDVDLPADTPVMLDFAPENTVAVPTSH